MLCRSLSVVLSMLLMLGDLASAATNPSSVAITSNGNVYELLPELVDWRTAVEVASRSRACGVSGYLASMSSASGSTALAYSL